jgi:pyruvate dehydrogenase E2 component (dihydrolipoyllysine-residue acetyltransferase)
VIVPEMRMPRLSESMREGIVVRWLREPGQLVAPGDELVEIETDKATVTCQAEAEGPLEILVGPGESAAVGAPIARIGATAAPPGPRLRASPLARRLARERNVDLAGVRGSGPGGRIVRADIERAGRAAEAVAPVASDDPRGGVTIQAPGPAQRVTAARMVEAVRAIPAFTVSAEFDMDRCVELRTRLARTTDRAPTHNDLVVKAAALALREHPRVNASYSDGAFHLYQRVNVGIAVAAGDALLVPTVYEADTLGLGAIARATRSLAERARAGALTPAELDGATFTVSNLGGFGITEFTAVINPPQAAILAVGAVVRRPVVRDGAVVPGHLLTATLTCDHRILDGASAARFLCRVGELLAEPLTLMLDGPVTEGARDER